MSIRVVCTGCKKSFDVNEKFAGKTGPCPKCKTIIKIPEKSQEVKVHGGEDFSTGGRTASGQLALKPIARKKVVITPKMIWAVAGTALGLIVVSLIARLIIGDNTVAQYIVGTLGLLLLSPVLTMAAYTFLRDDESDPYEGTMLYIRSAACAAAYTALWGFFVYVRYYVAEDGTVDLWMWVVVLPPFLLLGSAAAYLSFDLEPGNAFSHYAFYLVVTSLLAGIAGMGWAWA